MKYYKMQHSQGFLSKYNTEALLFLFSGWGWGGGRWRKQWAWRVVPHQPPQRRIEAKSRCPWLLQIPCGNRTRLGLRWGAYCRFCRLYPRYCIHNKTVHTVHAHLLVSVEVGRSRSGDEGRNIIYHTHRFEDLWELWIRLAKREELVFGKEKKQQAVVWRSVGNQTGSVWEGWLRKEWQYLNCAGIFCLFMFVCAGHMEG